MKQEKFPGMGIKKHFYWLPIEKTFRKSLHLTFSHRLILRGLSKSDIFSRQGQYK